MIAVSLTYAGTAGRPIRRTTIVDLLSRRGTNRATGLVIPARLPATMDARIDTSARAWTVVAAAFGAMFTVFGVAYSFGVFFDPMAREFGSGRAAAAAVFALTGFVYFSLGVVSGPVVDRVGPRRVLVVGAIAMSSGLLLTSRVHTLWAGYLTYWIGVGIGVACGHVPMVAVVGGWFERRRTFALGLAVAGIGTGTLVGGPLAGALISRYGWRTTYVIFGVASGILLLACAGAAAKPPVPTGGALRLSQSVRTAQFRTMYLAMVVMGMPLFHVLVFLVPFARSEGIGGGAAGLLIGIVGAASVVGRLGSARSAGGSGRSACSRSASPSWRSATRSGCSGRRTPRWSSSRSPWAWGTAGTSRCRRRWPRSCGAWLGSPRCVGRVPRPRGCRDVLAARNPASPGYGIADSACRGP